MMPLGMFGHKNTNHPPQPKGTWLKKTNPGPKEEARGGNLEKKVKKKENTLSSKKAKKKSERG